MITPLYAGLCGVLLLALSSRVVNARRQHKVALGDGGNADMFRAIRVQANFSEYVPLSLLLILLVEMNGHSAVTVHALGSALVAARVLHAVGLSRDSGASTGRFVGTLVTWMILALGSAILLMDSIPQ